MNEIDPELDRLRRAFASLEGRAPGSGCPDPERLWSAARGELAAEVVRPLVLHLVECGACAEAWRLAREVEPRRAQPLAVVASAASGRRSWIAWGALAAGMTIALAGSVALHQRLLERRPDQPPGFREGTRDDIRSLIPEGDALPRTRCVLRWTPSPEGTTYNVQVATERLEKVSEARGLTASAYQVPPEALAALPKGAKLLWRVEAVSPDGTRATSATFVARVE